MHANTFTYHGDHLESTNWVTDAEGEGYVNLQPYHYGANNPLKYGDPTGQFSEDGQTNLNTESVEFFTPGDGGGEVGSDPSPEQREPETREALDTIGGKTSVIRAGAGLRETVKRWSENRSEILLVPTKPGFRRYSECRKWRWESSESLAEKEQSRESL